MNEMLNELVNGLCDIFRNSLSSIILYGSYARHEEKDDSDVDIAIIINGAMNNETRERFIDFMSHMDLKFNKVFSGVDIEKDMIEKWGKVHPFYKNVLNEGVVLWKAA